MKELSFLVSIPDVESFDPTDWADRLEECAALEAASWTPIRFINFTIHDGVQMARFSCLAESRIH
jgi:hypothetical protein